MTVSFWRTKKTAPITMIRAVYNPQFAILISPLNVGA